MTLSYVLGGSEPKPQLFLVIRADGIPEQRGFQHRMSLWSWRAQVRSQKSSSGTTGQGSVTAGSTGLSNDTWQAGNGILLFVSTINQEHRSCKWHCSSWRCFNHSQVAMLLCRRWLWTLHLQERKSKWKSKWTCRLLVLTWKMSLRRMKVWCLVTRKLTWEIEMGKLKSPAPTRGCCCSRLIGRWEALPSPGQAAMKRKVANRDPGCQCPEIGAATWE